MEKNGKIICFYNRKGGVGKTTLSGNFAALLAKMKKKEGKTVMYLDLDSQNNAATTFLGYRKSDLERPIDEYANVLNLVGVNAESLNVHVPKLPIKSMVTRTDLNLWTIPPHGEMELYWRKTKEYEDDFTVFMEPFQELRKNFDYVVIDLPPAQDNMVLSALCASDFLIIPVKPDTVSTEGLPYFASKYIPIIKDFNPDFRVLGIVVNMYSKHKEEFCSNVIGEIAETTGFNVYDAKVRTSAGLDDPNNQKAGFMKSLRARSGLNRCVVAYDNYVFKMYPNAYDDVKNFYEETMRLMGDK